MKLSWILPAVFLLCALGAGYMTWMMWQAGDSGIWFFGVFTVFFLLLLATPILPKLRSKPPPPPTSTRFVPHWFMMLAILVVVVGIILAIIGAVLACPAIALSLSNGATADGALSPLTCPPSRQP